jgi:hypothetical protein
LYLHTVGTEGEKQRIEGGEIEERDVAGETEEDKRRERDREAMDTG